MKRETPTDMERRRRSTNTEGEEGNVHVTEKLEGNTPATSSKQAAQKNSPEKTTGRRRRRRGRAREKPVWVEEEQGNNRRDDHAAPLEKGSERQGPLPKHYNRRHRRRLR